jgi:hypothetical protein
MRNPFFSLAASSSRTTHLIRHQPPLTRRRVPSECCRGTTLSFRVRASSRGVVAFGHDHHRSFTISEGPPGGKNTPTSSKNNRKKSNFRTSSDNSKQNPEDDPPPPLAPSLTSSLTSSSHRRRLVVATKNNNNNNNKNKEIIVDKNTKDQAMLGTFKPTSLASKEIRDSYGQLILKPAATGISAAAQWQKLLRNYDQTKTRSNIESESSSLISKTASTDDSEKQKSGNVTSSPSTPSTATTRSTGDENILPHHPFPILNASVLLDTQRYIVRSGKFPATTTKSGTDAARRMLRGRKEWLQTVRKHVARGRHPATTTTSTGSSSQRQGGGGAYEIQGHGVPRQLLQNHVDFATKLLKRHRAWTVDFGAPPSTTSKIISSSSIFRDTKDWTMQVLGMDGDPSSYRTAPVLRAEAGVSATDYDSSTGDNCMPQYDDAHSLQLYLTVMHRLATTLSIVFRQQPQPQTEQQISENTPTMVGPTSLSSSYDEFDNAWSQSPGSAVTGNPKTISSSPSSPYMNPSFYDWKVEISREQCKNISGEEFAEENGQHADDNIDSFKSGPPKTFSTEEDTGGGKTSESGWRSRISSKIPAKEPLLTVQWIWPLYRVDLMLQGQSSLSTSSLSPSSPRLEENHDEERNPIVSMKYTATFYPRQQQIMSSRGRFL